MIVKDVHGSKTYLWLEMKKSDDDVTDRIERFKNRNLKQGSVSHRSKTNGFRQALLYSFCVSILGLKPIFCYIKTLFATKVCKNDPKICGSLNFFKSLNKIVEPWSPSSQTTNKHVPSFAF